MVDSPFIELGNDSSARHLFAFQVGEDSGSMKSEFSTELLDRLASTIGSYEFFSLGRQESVLRLRLLGDGSTQSLGASKNLGQNGNRSTEVDRGVRKLSREVHSSLSISQHSGMSALVMARV